jgi:hypothetical protein
MAGIFSLVGSLVSAAGTIAAGSAQNSAAQAQAQMSVYRAQQESQAAAISRATGQRKAEEESRKGELAQSQLQARAAADGGMATDPTVLALGEDIAGRAALGKRIEYFKGEEEAIGHLDQSTLYHMQADAQLAQGRAAQKASMFSALGTIIGGAGSAYSAFTKTPAAPTYKNVYGYG